MHITVELFKTKPARLDVSKVHRIMSVFDKTNPGSIITAVPPRLFPNLGDNLMVAINIYIHILSYTLHKVMFSYNVIIYSRISIVQNSLSDTAKDSWLQN